MEEKSWTPALRRAQPGLQDAFEAFGVDLGDYTSHQHHRWEERVEPFDEAHCRACADRLWELSNQFEHYALLNALYNFSYHMGHEARGLQRREACFLLELLLTPEVDALIHLPTRTERLTHETQWRAHVEAALERSTTPLPLDTLTTHLSRLLRAGEPPSATTSSFSGRRSVHEQVSSYVAGVLPWVRVVYGLEAALVICFDLMHEGALGRGLMALGSTAGHEEYAINLLHEELGASLLAAPIPASPKEAQTANIANILYRCPDQQLILSWLPHIINHHKTSSVDHSPNLDRVLFAISDDALLMDRLREHRITLFERDVWLLYGRMGAACIEDLGALIMSRANAPRRPRLLRALWPVCEESLAPLMLQAALGVDCSDVATSWLKHQGADATLGLMRQARRRGKIGHLANTLLKEIVAQGHEEEVRGLLPALKDPSLTGHIEEELLTTTTPRDDEGEVVEGAPGGSSREELRAFPEALEALSCYPIGGAEAAARDAFLKDMDDVLHLDRAPLVRAIAPPGEATRALSRELLAQIFWCITLVKPLDRRKGKKGKERDEREAMQARLHATLSRLREAFNADDLAALTRHTLESWWAHERPAAQMWCIWLLGYCGGEDEALWMREKMRTMNRWFPKTHLRQSTLDVIEALAVMDSPMSRMMLDVLIEEGRNELICLSASAAKELLCEEHRFDEATWQDQSVPTARLDAHGKRRFSYGARHFDLTFRGAFEIALLGSDGKVYERLPAARKSDDQGAVQEARKLYAEVSAQLSLVVERQRRRLERCLSEQHGWAPEVWRACMAEHVLMRHFARMLIWKVVREELVDGVLEERVERIFVWTEEGEAMGVDYEHIPWEELTRGGELIRLLHPCDVSEQELIAWSELFMAFEVVQPVRQLERSRRGFEPHEEEALPGALRSDKVWSILRELDGWRAEHGDRYKIIVFWREWGSAWRVIWTHDEEDAWRVAKEKGLVGAPPARPGLYVMGLGERVTEQGVCLPRERVPDWLMAEVRTSLEALLARAL